jgi:hypothetical protein
MRTRLGTTISCGKATELDIEELFRQSVDDRVRSRRRTLVNADDAAKMIDEFIARQGGITRCPPAYAALSPQYSL